jgi:hypothetical protein
VPEPVTSRDAIRQALLQYPGGLGLSGMHLEDAVTYFEGLLTPVLRAQFERHARGEGRMCLCHHPALGAHYDVGGPCMVEDCSCEEYRDALVELERLQAEVRRLARELDLAVEPNTYPAIYALLREQGSGEG